ncbi:MAG: hypothetical protein KJ066_09710 [Acidobacteria bacterium]|nr:hypothetical protein [Acidobacteriota bacterium]
MSAFTAFRNGLARVARAPWLVVGLWLATVAFGLPLAAVMRATLADDLGPSLVSASVADGVDWEWWQEFRDRASGLGRSFGPAILGGAAVVKNASDLADNVPLATALAAVVAGWLAFGAFLSGGAIDRLARNRALGASGFFGSAGRLFVRMLRLGACAWLAYAVLFGWVHGWLFDDLFRWLTRDLTVERTAFLWRLALYVLFALPLVGVNLMVDYARVRLVVEDRRSVLAALLAGARFVGRRLSRVALLYGLNLALFVGVAVLYLLVAPSAGGAWWWPVAVGQVYVLGRAFVKLQFYASSAAFFQGELAHADQLTSPTPEWPESPAAEAIRG